MRRSRPTADDHVLIFELLPRDKATVGESVLFGEADIKLLLPKGHDANAVIATEIRITNSDINSVFAQSQDQRSVFGFEATNFHLGEHLPVKMEESL